MADVLQATISINFVAIENKSAMIHTITWCQTGDKTLCDHIIVLFIDAYMRHLASMR